MFDLITGKTAHTPRHQAGPIVVSVVAHVVLIGAVFIGPVMFVVAPIPAEQMMMAFVVGAAAPPPPPPPPPGPPPEPRARAARPVPTWGDVAPIEPPNEIAPEPSADFAQMTGVEGGVPGGIPGGVVGGLVPEAPPPPPPPPPPPRGPIRIGGQVKEPTLVHRVEPVYPALAVARQLEGIVILEALVDQHGRVEDVRVLRSNGVFDAAALEAVRQWRYSPVLLNGQPEKFILTVVVSFTLTK